ncbi:MAG: hypothetical protein EON92_06235 [Burkholderiales bacterium]|nr:MAG: hypothetical protein EON92_06235 [Burkholderiales bacterium]
MANLKARHGFSGPEGTFDKGDALPKDIPAARARELVEQGYAVEVDAPDDAPAPAAVPAKSAAKRK